MAEEIKYIPYGTEEIDYNQFLQNSANSVQNYVNQQPWSQKRKQSFLNAYQDLMTKGIIGANNNTGVWTINHNGEQIDLNSKSKIDREMYGEAAYFIQQQMSKLPTKQAQQQKEEEEKAKLPLFDNNYFTSQFNTHISNQMFGGRDFKTEDDWNILDERGENGLRGTKIRANKLADMLQSYSESLEEGKFNFENSPFKDLNDFKTRIGQTISQLRDDDPNNDVEALNRIGLKYNDYLYNGSDDPFKKDGYEGNYGDYYGRYLPEQEELKRKQQQEEAEAKAAEAKAKAAKVNANRYKKLVFIKGQGKSLQYLSKYPNIIKQLNSYAQSTSPLTNDQRQEIIGAFRGAAANGYLQNLSREELQRFGNGYANQPNRLKKLPGLEGFYWDTIGDRVIKPLMDVNNTGGDFQALVNSNNPNTNPRGKGLQLTAADYADIGATLADFAALVDPEAISGTVLSLGAATTRTINRDWKNGDFWTNLGGSAFDLLTGAIGGLPLIGDASSAVKFVKNAAKWMAIPSVVMALKDAPEAKKAWDKIDLSHPYDSVKKLTPNDYKALYNFTAGLLGTKNSIKNNRAERKILQESGFSTQAKTRRREYANKLGITPTKVNNSTRVPTVKVKVNGKEEDIEISDDIKSKIEKRVKSAGKDVEARNNAVKEELKAAKKVKDTDNIEIVSPSTVRDSRILRPWVGTTRKIFGTSSIQNNTRGTDNFENWLNNRSTWDQWKPWSYGSNSNLRRIRENMLGKDFDESELLHVSSGENSPYARQPLEQQKIKASNKIDWHPEKTSPRESNIRRAVMQRYKAIQEGKFSNKDLSDSKTKIGNENVTVYNTTTGSGDHVISIYTSKGAHRFNSQQEAKKFIARLVKEQRHNITKGSITKSNIKEIGKVLQDLKRKGWLKQGGQINTLNKTISDFLNNNEL